MFSLKTCALYWGLHTTAKQNEAQERYEHSKIRQNKKIRGLYRERHHHILLVAHKWWFRGIMITWAKMLHFMPFQFQESRGFWKFHNDGFTFVYFNHATQLLGAGLCLQAHLMKLTQTYARLQIINRAVYFMMQSLAVFSVSLNYCVCVTCACLSHQSSVFIC